MPNSNSLKRAFLRPSHAPRKGLPRAGEGNGWAVAGALLALLALFYPAVLRDLTDWVATSPEGFTGLRWGMAALAIFILAQRRLNWWEPLLLLLAVFGVLGNYAQNIGAEQYLTLSDLAVRLSLAGFMVRLLFRPTPYEDREAIKHQAQVIAWQDKGLQNLRARLHQHGDYDYDDPEHDSAYPPEPT